MLPNIHCLQYRSGYRALFQIVAMGIGFSLLTLTTLPGCGSSMRYSPCVRKHLVENEFDHALDAVKNNQEKYSTLESALYYLDLGLLSHYAGHYQESVQYLSIAEKTMTELYTKRISNESASLLIEDKMQPYEGEDFEKVLVNVFNALNFAAMQEWEKALVEGRRVQVKLQTLKDKYGNAHKNGYRDDPFARFLTGIFYDIQGNDNDAFIAYKKAKLAYTQNHTQSHGSLKIPDLIHEKLICSADANGFRDEKRAAIKEYSRGPTVSCSLNAQQGEIIIIHYQGLIPEKIESKHPVTMPDGYHVNLSIPVFKEKQPLFRHAQVRLQSMENGRTLNSTPEMMEDITAIATENLKNRTAWLKTRCIARAGTQYAVTEGLGLALDQAVGGWQGQLLGALLKGTREGAGNADLRQWRTLPARISTGRILAPPGRYTAMVEYFDANNNKTTRKNQPAIQVKQGETRFLFLTSLK